MQNLQEVAVNNQNLQEAVIYNQWQPERLEASITSKFSWWSPREGNRRQESSHHTYRRPLDLCSRAPQNSLYLRHWEGQWPRGKCPRSYFEFLRDSTLGNAWRADIQLHDAYERKFRKLVWWITELDDRQKSDDRSVMYDSRPPFSWQIMEEVIPPHFKVSQLECYDRTTDPLDHLSTFKAHMMIQEASNAFHFWPSLQL